MALKDTCAGLAVVAAVLAGALLLAPTRISTAAQAEGPQGAPTVPPVLPAPAGRGMRGGLPPGMGEMTPEQRAMMMAAMSGAGAAAMAIAPDGSVYVLRGAALYRYSPDLQLLASTTLPAPQPPAGRGR